MDYKRLKRLLNQIVVKGKTKRTFWRKSKDFELQIYYTPVKNRIVIINITGCDINDSNLGFNFKMGGDIDDVFNWIQKNDHKIIFERNRLQN